MTLTTPITRRPQSAFRDPHPRSSESVAEPSTHTKVPRPCFRPSLPGGTWKGSHWLSMSVSLSHQDTHRLPLSLSLSLYTRIHLNKDTYTCTDSAGSERVCNAHSRRSASALARLGAVSASSWLSWRFCTRIYQDAAVLKNIRRRQAITYPELVRTSCAVVCPLCLQGPLNGNPYSDTPLPKLQNQMTKGMRDRTS